MRKPTNQIARTLVKSLFIGAVGLSAASGFGQTYQVVTPKSAGLLNDWLRTEDPAFTNWDFGGQIRARFESKSDFAEPGVPKAIDFRKNGGDNGNDYLLLREKLHGGYNGDWFKVYVEGRDSSTDNDDRNPNIESDTADLHQAYVVIGNPSQFPLTLKAGRQEMIYGDERLIGNSDWNNIPRTFDAAKLRWETTNWWVDAFVSRVVVPDDDNFNVSNDYETFSGLYSSAKNWIPKTETQLYFLSRNTEVRSPKLQTGNLTGLPTARDIYTVGGRLKSLPKALGNWDYEVEGAYQFGRWKATSGKNLTQDAFAAHISGGYTFTNLTGTPRLSLEYNFASGDDNAADGTHGTFDNLYPTNHKFYGYMDFISWQNIHDLAFSASAKAGGKLMLSASGHAFWLADTHDSFYNVTGAARTGGGVGTGTGYAINPSYSHYVGSEVDFVASYPLKPSAILQAGYGHFFVGDYIKSSLSSPAFGSHDADWIFAQLIFNF